jgi:hypothetical protein
MLFFFFSTFLVYFITRYARSAARARRTLYAEGTRAAYSAQEVTPVARYSAFAIDDADAIFSRRRRFDAVISPPLPFADFRRRYLRR